jgi:hypothetical protein
MIAKIRLLRAKKPGNIDQEGTVTSSDESSYNEVLVDFTMPICPSDLMLI